MSRVPILVLTLVLFFAATPASTFGQAQCPWMNAATAGGFLGGEVQTAVTAVTVDGDATCEFSRASSMLRIAVHTMSHVSQQYPTYLSQCGGAGAVALKGIGNQAVQCMRNSGEGKSEELIVGRVRERAFIISIKAKWIRDLPTSPTKTRNPISDDSENVAEQVAGSMF